MKIKVKDIYFFIGTEAELIKVFTVIMECQKLGAICHIIASGQNDLKRNRILNYIELNGQYIELSQEKNIKKSAVGLLQWFFETKNNAINTIASHFPPKKLKGTNLVVHGDTVSTLMGALLGRKLGMTVCHVEAGLRSHHLFNPFPEEIDRLLTSRIARVHFAPGKEPEQNLRKAKGIVINTQYNTILDSLRISRQLPVETEAVEKLQGKDYFVFVMHRQENLMNETFVREVAKNINKFAQNKTAVVILHTITKNKFEEMGILQEMEQNDKYVLLPRVDYFDFMKLLEGAQYVITDGGSNQEELHYMGKPCMIMRKTTERKEGIGENAVMIDGNMKNMNCFVSQYEKYQKGQVRAMESPSKIIATTLINNQ